MPKMTIEEVEALFTPEVMERIVNRIMDMLDLKAQPNKHPENKLVSIGAAWGLRAKNSPVLAHQDHCGLDTDHKGPCVTTSTRDIGTQTPYNPEMVEKIKAAANSPPAASFKSAEEANKWIDGISTQNPENQKHEHIWDMSISGDRRCCTCGISSKN